jgi:integrase
MPAHHNLEAYLDAYIEAAGIRDGGKAPLFRSAAGRTGTLTTTAMNRVDAWRMIQRRAAELGTRARIGCHTFRATGITLNCPLAAGYNGLGDPRPAVTNYVTTHQINEGTYRRASAA